MVKTVKSEFGTLISEDYANGLVQRAGALNVS